jgi:hypothetical protein
MSNATRYAKFAPENEAAAEAFAAKCDAVLPPALVSWPRRFEETMGANFQAGHLFRDTNLNWVVAYPFDGPFTFNGSTIAAPANIASYLALAVIVDTADWYSFS